ncbi:MAG: class I SAM-dependent methyltransferase [Candidatus Hydrothermarchaeota archaeon]
MRNSFDRKEVQELYARMAPFYNGKDSFHENLFYEKVESIIKEIDMGDFILDIGCGTGFPSQLLLSMGKKVIGIDISPELIFKAPKNMDYILSDAQYLPFKDESFDSVVSIGGVLNHMPNYDLAFKEINRVLKKDGIFVFDVENKWNLELLWRLIGFYGISLAKEAFLSLKPGPSIMTWQDFSYNVNHDKINANKVKKFDKFDGIKIKQYYFTYNSMLKSLKENGFTLIKKYGINILTPLIPPNNYGNRSIEKLIGFLGRIDHSFLEKFLYRFGSSILFVCRKN